MKRMSKRFLKKIDVYGAPFFFQLKGQNKEQKTKSGGCYTLILLLLTLIYGSLKLRMWFNGDLSPFIFSLEKQIDSDFKYVMERNYFNLLIVGPPLPLNLVYFIPVVLTVFGGKRMNISERLIDKNCSFQGGYCLKNDLELRTSQTNRASEISYAIQLLECQEEYLSPNQTCASKEQMNSFFNGSNQIAISLFQRIINQRTLKPQIASHQLQIYIEQGKFFAGYLSLEIQRLFYSSGYPFAKSQYFEFISNNHILTAQYNESLGRTRTVGNNVAYGELYIAMSKNQIDTEVQEQKLIDQIILIFSFLQGGYSLGIIFQIRAESKLKKKIKEKLTPIAHGNQSITSIEQNLFTIEDKLQILNILSTLILLEKSHVHKLQNRKLKRLKKNGRNSNSVLENNPMSDSDFYESTPQEIDLSSEYFYNWNDRQKIGNK